MPETILSRGQALAEKGIVTGVRPDVRDTVGVSVDVNRAIQSVQRQGVRYIRQSGLKIALSIAL
jgi:hypothetical protein